MVRAERSEVKSERYIIRISLYCSVFAKRTVVFRVASAVFGYDSPPLCECLGCMQSRKAYE